MWVRGIGRFFVCGFRVNFTYDPVGNRLTSLGVANYTNNSSNELTSTSNAAYT